MSRALVLEHADMVENLHHSRAIFALRLDACEPEQRVWLLDHHNRVMQVLRERGHRVKSNVITNEDGEHVTIRIVTGPNWLI